MRLRAVIISVLVVGAMASWGWRWSSRPVEPPTALTARVPAPSAVAQPQPMPVAADTVPPPDERPPRTLRLPIEFTGFETWTSERQLDAVTDLQQNPRLSPAMRAFLIDLASDPGRRAVLRNNAANALGIQDPPVPGWLGRLADQALDPAETPIWRDYALQHLSDQLIPRGEVPPTTGDFIGSPDSGLDRQRYIAVLTAVATSTLPVAGTALLHLDRLSREHGVAIDQARFHGLILHVLHGDDVDIGAKITALGILGLRGDPADADIPRRYLQHGDPDIRRCAVAALGHLGSEQDIQAIEAVEAAGDRTVEMAKIGACKRLRERFAKPVVK